LRAHALEDLGLLQTVDPAALNPETLGEAIRGRLTTLPPTVALDFGGLGRIARRARALLGLEDAVGEPN
jgi:predicted glycosyltransferase